MIAVQKNVDAVAADEARVGVGGKRGEERRAGGLQIGRSLDLYAWRARHREHQEEREEEDRGARLHDERYRKFGAMLTSAPAADALVRRSAR